MTCVAVAYCTPDYGDYADRLQASADKHKVPLWLNRLPFDKPWGDAVCYKPKFIYECLEAAKRGIYGHGVEGILYTDADSEFKRHPPWGEVLDFDIAYHEFQRSSVHNVETLTGSMWFRNTDDVRNFVWAWHGATEGVRGVHREKTPEQDSLKKLLAMSSEFGLKIGQLESTWCWVYDDFPKLYGNMQPIIEHYQASRVMKKVKRGKWRGRDKAKA